MSDAPSRALSHFALFRFTRDYWALSQPDRRGLAEAWLDDLRRGAEAVEVYQAYPSTTSADICIWSSVPAETPETAALFFQAFARATNPQRLYVEPVTTLWGYSRPSQYSSAQRSAQSIDVYQGERRRYLVIYPFVKTSEWYLKSREERQLLMNEHIRIGKQYTEVSQMLLYSVGLQDQEFVVVYEMDDLQRFSDLVSELRSTAGRPFTLRDTPIHTCVWHPAGDALTLF